jgi:hypothetical protein
MDCCKTELGNFPHNQDINTQLSTDEVGVHVIEFDSINGTRLKLEVNITDPNSETIIIPKGYLNESYYYCFTIKKPSGTYIVDENDCNKFCISTYIQTFPECGDNCE